MGKKAVLVVSFGTTYRETLEENISAIEGEIAATLPDRDLKRAFTSGIIMGILRRRDSLVIPNTAEALEALLAQGYTDVVLQPTHLMNGDEYDKLRAQAAPYEGRFERFTVGKPLLSDLADYPAVAGALLTALPPHEAGRAVVLMGHGSPHFANAAYALLEYVLHDLGRGDVVIGTVEGYPTLDEVLRRLGEQEGVRAVELRPLMIVAGDHAQNDMAGTEEDSWRARLEGAGYTVHCQLTGLGEYPAIRHIFAEHARAAAEGTA